MKKYQALAVVAITTVAQGCATITRGTTESVELTSQPSEAQVALSTGLKCITPCVLEMKRKHGFSGEFSKEGYQSISFHVLSSVSGGGAAGFAGNVIIGGLIGMGIDAMSGSMKTLSPNPVHAVLAEEGSAETSKLVYPAETPGDEQSEPDTADQPEPHDNTDH